jgi:predicted metal-binding protein
VPVFAATETVTGQIIDQQCYLKDMANNKGNDHKMPADMAGCAAACAKKGLPLALLTSDGKVYTIAGDLAANMNAKLVPHVSHTVSITGDVTTAAGKNTITAGELKMVSK